MKIGQRIKFMKFTDDSSRAVDKFCVEPQNDWFDVEVYTEVVEAIIVWNKGLLLAQQIYKNNKRGNVYDISKNGIKRRIENLKERLEGYSVSIDDWILEESGFSDDESFGFELMYKIIKH